MRCSTILVKPAKLSYKTLDKILQVLWNHVRPKPSCSVFTSARMFTQTGKLLEIPSLTEKPLEHCDFGGQLENMFHDGIVCGIKNSDIPTRLLEKADLPFRLCRLWKQLKKTQWQLPKQAVAMFSQLTVSRRAWGRPQLRGWTPCKPSAATATSGDKVCNWKRKDSQACSLPSTVRSRHAVHRRRATIDE